MSQSQKHDFQINILTRPSQAYRFSFLIWSTLANLAFEAGFRNLCSFFIILITAIYKDTPTPQDPAWWEHLASCKLEPRPTKPSK